MKLKLHVKTVHGDNSKKKYKCVYCEKAFISKNMLDAHMMNIHIKTRPYSCRFGCDFSYNDISNRNSHEKMKHGGLFKL